MSKFSSIVVITLMSVVFTYILMVNFKASIPFSQTVYAETENESLYLPLKENPANEETLEEVVDEEILQEVWEEDAPQDEIIDETSIENSEGVHEHYEDPTRSKDMESAELNTGGVEEDQTDQHNHDPIDEEGSEEEEMMSDRNNAEMKEKLLKKNTDHSSEIKSEKMENQENLTIETSIDLTPESVLGLDLLRFTNLKVEYIREENKFILIYTGSAVFDVGMISNFFVTFQVPEEIQRVIEPDSVKLKYDMPGVPRKTGEVDPAFNGINQYDYNFKSLLSASLPNSYKYTLEFRVTERPLIQSGQYCFRARASDALVDLSILSSSNYTSGCDPLLPAQLTMIVPENITFERTDASFQGNVGRVGSPGISVTDTRGGDSRWRFFASIAQPFTSSSGHTLPGALVFKNDSNIIHLSESGTLIAEGGTGVTSVEWSEHNGLLVNTQGLFPRNDTYSTEIVWTLVDAP